MLKFSPAFQGVYLFNIHECLIDLQPCQQIRFFSLLLPVELFVRVPALKEGLLMGALAVFKRHILLKYGYSKS